MSSAGTLRGNLSIQYQWEAKMKTQTDLSAFSSLLSATVVGLLLYATSPLIPSAHGLTEDKARTMISDLNTSISENNKIINSLKRQINYFKKVLNDPDVLIIPKVNVREALPTDYKFNYVLQRRDDYAKILKFELFLELAKHNDSLSKIDAQKRLEKALEMRQRYLKAIKNTENKSKELRNQLSRDIQLAEQRVSRLIRQNENMSSQKNRLGKKVTALDNRKPDKTNTPQPIRGTLTVPGWPSKKLVESEDYYYVVTCRAYSTLTKKPLHPEQPKTFGGAKAFKKFVNQTNDFCAPSDRYKRYTTLRIEVYRKSDKKKKKPVQKFYSKREPGKTGDFPISATDSPSSSK
jgi:hypothetical protein